MARIVTGLCKTSSAPSAIASPNGVSLNIRVAIILAVSPGPYLLLSVAIRFKVSLANKPVKNLPLPLVTSEAGEIPSPVSIAPCIREPAIIGVAFLGSCGLPYSSKVVDSLSISGADIPTPVPTISAVLSALGACVSLPIPCKADFVPKPVANIGTKFSAAAEPIFSTIPASGNGAGYNTLAVSSTFCAYSVRFEPVSLAPSLSNAKPPTLATLAGVVATPRKKSRVIFPIMLPSRLNSCASLAFSASSCSIALNPSIFALASSRLDKKSKAALYSFLRVFLSEGFKDSHTPLSLNVLRFLVNWSKLRFSIAAL